VDEVLVVHDAACGACAGVVRDLPQLLRVPTAFTILPLQVRQLREAGRRTLRASAEFQALVQFLEAPEASVADGGGANSMD